MAETRYERVPLTITAAGTTTNEVLDLQGYNHLGLILPAAFTGIALSFTVCDTATGTFVPLTDSAGATLSYVVAPSKAVAFGDRTNTDLLAFRFMKVVSGSAEGATRTIIAVLRRA